MRMDGVFRHNDGLIYIYDHKHTYKVDKATEMKYTLSGQFMGAQWFGAKIWGKEFGGVILNLSCSYPMSAGSKKLQFLRRPLPAAPAMFERFPDTIRYAADQMKRFAGLKLDAYPRAMNEQICMTAYGPCDFFDRCRWGK